MSLILDALRKSERVRHQSLTGQLSAGETAAGPGRLPVPWVTLIALLLVANALLLFFFWPRPEAPPAAAPQPRVPASAQAYRPSVRPLAQETDEVVASQAPLQAQVDTPVLSNAAPRAAAPADPTVSPTPLPPGIDGLPEDVRQTLPTLHLDVHGYAGNPKDRFVVINLKQFHIGDQVADGVTLKDIVPQGAVLEYRGSVFLLPAS